MEVIKKTMLTYVSSTGNGIGGNNGNNNKFYYLELRKNDDVYIEYGRIGNSKQTKLKPRVGEREYNKILKSKLKKEYKVSEIDLESNSGELTTNSNLSVTDIALKQITIKDDVSKNFIKFIIQQNIHNITSNTKIKFDHKTGLFTTPLGVVKKHGIEKAKKSLDSIFSIIDGIDDVNKLTKSKKDKFIKFNEEYFSIIPTLLSNLRNINTLLINQDKLTEQYDICDTLLTTIDIIEKEKDKTINKTIEKGPKLFDTEIGVLKDTKKYKEIEKYFNNSKNNGHGRYINNAKITNIFKVKLNNEDENFKKDLGNVMELWHGTKVANLLSILKSGLLMPNQSPGQMTGYMFGKGLYFSDQSTKSLNYCDGMYWNNSSKQPKIYMFLASIAMGNYEVPNSYRNSSPTKGYDSYWAKPAKSGIQNNEMIVFKKNQIRLDYILEIKV